MTFLILSITCFAMVAANGYQPKPADDNSYGTADNDAGYGNQYPPSNPTYPGGGYGNYDDRSREHDFKKLRDLRGVNIIDADIKYYQNKGDYYARITCGNNPNSNQYTWILADSDDKIPSFGIDNTVALAGGLNVDYVAKYRHGKWTGRDAFEDDKQKFRRVGCFHGSFDSKLQ